MPPKPIALPNVSQETIARQAYALFGAMAEVDAANLALSETRKSVSEAGVDPGILADVMREAKADPWSRMERDRTLSQYVSALKAPGLVAASPDMFAALDEPEPESDEERKAREHSEGFWAYLTHAVTVEPREADQPLAFIAGWLEARALING